MSLVFLPVPLAIAGFGAFIMMKALRADQTLYRQRSISRTPKQRRAAKLILISYPTFMVVGAGVGAIADGTDRVGGSLGGLVIGMFVWLPAAWIVGLEAARRRRAQLDHAERQ